MTLGQKIRSARIERGYTQKQLVGEHITRNMLSKIENDSATPSVRTLEYIAARLQMPVSYFMDNTKYSDGTSLDGLDEMRRAYKSGEYLECIRLLEESTSVGTTDEGYLLRTLSSLGAAHEELKKGNFPGAKEYADAADYYNKEGLYYSAAVDAEMSLILAECALVLDMGEYEENAREYERAVKDISFQDRYALVKAEYLLRTEETELAEKVLTKLSPSGDPKYLYLMGFYHLRTGKTDEAIMCLKEAEFSAKNTPLLPLIYEKLEECYLKREDFRLAYEYAAKQLRGNE